MSSVSPLNDDNGRRASKEKSAPDAQQRACEFLIRASNPLQISDPTNSPIGIASACLVDHGGHRWILTVAHATGNLGRWAIEMEFDEPRGAKLLNIGAMHFTGLINFT